MIKKNNKGFTLLELLISIFILTTVIFLGYKVINKSTMYIKNQSNIHKGQLTVNDMNEYLTKDLEKASSIALFLNNEKIADTYVEENENKEDKQNILSDKINDLKDELNKLSIDSKLDYSYIIRIKNNEINSYSITYSVSITRTNQYYKYNITRKYANNIKISFINESVLKEKELPFVIEGNIPYKVILGYTGKNKDFIKYEFTVTSRLYDIILPEQEMPPAVEDIIPPSNWGDYNVIGFWTADSRKKEDNNLYTWISTKGEKLADAYANQNNTTEKFNIQGYARSGNNTKTGSYIGYNEMVEEGWSGQIVDVEIGDKAISEISIYLSPNTKLEDFNIKSTQGSAKIQVSKPLKEGWNHCTVESNSNSPVSFEFTGKLSIDKGETNSGYAYVVYKRDSNSTAEGDSSDKDHSDEESDGDIVFEFIRENDRVYITPEINIGNNPGKGNPTDTQNGVFNFESLIGRSDISISIGGKNTSDDNFKNIKGIEIKLVGNITVPKFEIDHVTGEIELGLNFHDKFYFDFTGHTQHYGLRFRQIDIKNLETAKIIINLIY